MHGIEILPIELQPPKAGLVVAVFDPQVTIHVNHSEASKSDAYELCQMYWARIPKRWRNLASDECFSPPRSGFRGKLYVSGIFQSLSESQYILLLWVLDQRSCDLLRHHRQALNEAFRLRLQQYTPNELLSPEVAAELLAYFKAKLHAETLTIPTKRKSSFWEQWAQIDHLSQEKK